MTAVVRTPIPHLSANPSAACAYLEDYGFTNSPPSHSQYDAILSFGYAVAQLKPATRFYSMYSNFRRIHNPLHVTLSAAEEITRYIGMGEETLDRWRNVHCLWTHPRLFIFLDFYYLRI
jgi:hypothetical protein